MCSMNNPTRRLLEQRTPPAGALTCNNDVRQLMASADVCDKVICCYHFLFSMIIYVVHKLRCGAFGAGQAEEELSGLHGVVNHLAIASNVPPAFSSHSAHRRLLQFR